LDTNSASATNFEAVGASKHWLLLPVKLRLTEFNTSKNMALGSIFCCMCNQDRNHGGRRRAKPPLQNFTPPWKNVLSIVENYWTLFKKFGPLSESSSPPLMSQTGYGPVCNYGFCFEAYVSMTVFVACFDFRIFGCMQNLKQTYDSSLKTEA